MLCACGGGSTWTFSAMSAACVARPDDAVIPSFLSLPPAARSGSRRPTTCPAITHQDGHQCQPLQTPQPGLRPYPPRPPRLPPSQPPPTPHSSMPTTPRTPRGTPRPAQPNYSTSPVAPQPTATWSTPSPSTPGNAPGS